jgi:hypothetical protein
LDVHSGMEGLLYPNSFKTDEIDDELTKQMKNTT